MAVQKLETTDGFVVRDFAGAPSSGIVRRGRKILQRSATDLARSATYGFAFHGIKRGGASAGLNAEGEAEGPALEALAAELADQLGEGTLELFPAKGIGADELGAAVAAGTGDEGVARTYDDGPLVAGVLAATAWALGGSLDGRRLFIEGDSSDPTYEALSSAAAETGAVIVDSSATDDKPWAVWATEADAALVGSRPGAMNHQGAELLNCSAVVPWGPIPVTTKALATMLKRGITYVPDFISASGPFIDRHLDHDQGPDTDQLARRVTDGLGDLDTTTDPLFIAASHRAESFITSWQDKLPFGRPLAG